MSWKRILADAIGRRLGVHVTPRGHGHVQELLEFDYLEKFFKEFDIDCVFDVGANEGQYAERIRELGFKGAIISFEPIPELAEKLRKKSEKDSAWFIEEIALDEVARPVTFNIMVGNKFSSLLHPSHNETSLFEKRNKIVNQIERQTGILEVYFDMYQNRLCFSRPFLKMDTQGADICVAKGAGPRLGAFIGLQSELSFKKIYEGQPTYREAIDFYEGRGFALTGLVPNNAGHFPTLVELDCIMYNTRSLPAR